MSTAQNSKQIKNIALAGLLAALTFVVTAYLHIPVGTNGGYIHPGDGVIFLAASLLSTPYAVVASAIGGVLADGLSGAYIWIPATLVIKAVTALFFTSKGSKIITVRNLLGIIPSLILCIVGYAVYEGVVIAGGFSKAAMIAAFAGAPMSCVQVALSSILYIVLGLALDKIGFKKKMEI